MSILNLPDMSHQTYWCSLQDWAKLNSDGCTCVHDFYVQACWEHDWHHRYAVTLYGDPITFDETNLRFREVMQMLSRLKWFSPLSWIRYYGVRELGRGIWNRHRAENLSPPFRLSH